MTAYYVEPKTYPNYTATPANTTTAYDGDGLAKGLATPAVKALDLTGITASSGDTFVVCGATLTGADNASPPANTFDTTGSPSGSTLATRLASAINAATNAVNAAATGWTTPQLRNACYASASGATLTIQTRAGSAVYNSNATLWSVTSTGFSPSNFTQSTFTGGASGAWGFLFSDSNDGSSGVMWPSGVARNAYGVCFTGNNTAPIAGPSGSISYDNDIVHVRGTSTVIYASPGGAVGAGAAFTRSAFFLFDDGTEWSGGPSNPGITFNSRSIYYDTYSVQTTGVKLAWVGRSADTILFTGGGSRFGLSNGTNSILLENAKFVHSSGTASDQIGKIGPQSSIAASTMVYRKCNFVCSVANLFFQWCGISGGGYSANRTVIEDCTFDFSLYTGSASYMMGLGSNTTAGNYVAFRGNKFVGSANISVFGNRTGTLYGAFVAENNTGFAIYDGAGLMGQTTGVENSEYRCEILQQGMLSPEHLRLETPELVLEWNPSGSFPTYNSYLPSGTAWSTRWLWTNSANAFRAGGIEIIRRSMYVTQASQQTVTLELAFDGAVSPKVGELELIVMYTKNSDNSLSCESSWTTGDKGRDLTNNIATSSASWDGFTGTYSAWVARKLTVTLSDDIKQNTNIDVMLICHRPTTAAAPTSVFINPEIGLAA